MKTVKMTIMLSAMVLMASVAGAAVVPYSEDFNYAAGTNPTDVLAWEVTGGAPYFNGLGQLVMSRQSGSNDDLNNYYIGSGDFTATLKLVDINMAPVENWSVWNYRIYHYGGHSMNINLDSSGSGQTENVSIWIDAWSETISGNHYGENIGELNELILQVVYDAGAGTYSWSRAVDGGPMQLMAVLGGYTSPDDNRRIRFNSDHATIYPSVSLDSFVLIPEPGTLAILSLGVGLFLRKRK